MLKEKLTSGVPPRFQPSKAGFDQYQAQANQQKSIAASGQPKMQYGGGGYGQAQNVIKNAWANYNPSYSQYAKEGQQGASQADAFNQRNAAIKAKKDKEENGGAAGGGGGDYNGQSTIKPPSYIADALTEDAANNAMAQGYQQADPRYQMKRLARAGMSSGAGQQFIAGQEGVQAMGQAAGQASDIRMQDQMANSRMRSDYEKAREMEAQHNTMLQHSLGQSEWTRNFAQQSVKAQNQMAYLQGMLGLQMALLR